MIDLSFENLNIVKNILAEHIPEIEVRAFGSRVCGSAKKHSDLDLALFFDKPIELSQIANLRYAFEESNLPIKVDIVEFVSLSDNFKEIINKKNEVIQG